MVRPVRNRQPLLVTGEHIPDPNRKENKKKRLGSINYIPKPKKVEKALKLNVVITGA
jgi:hypothetical protein